MSVVVARTPLVVLGRLVGLLVVEGAVRLHASHVIREELETFLARVHGQGMAKFKRTVAAGRPLPRAAPLGP